MIIGTMVHEMRQAHFHMNLAFIAVGNSSSRRADVAGC